MDGGEKIFATKKFCWGEVRFPGSSGKIFLTFERDTTNYRGTLVENVKKVKNQPTLLCRL
jgi:hypothetical protein